MTSTTPPTEAEMRAAGVALGHLAEGEPVPAHLRTKLAKTARLAKEEAAAQSASGEATDKVATPLIDLHVALTGAGLPTENVGRIVAAIAPHVWRAHQ